VLYSMAGCLLACIEWPLWNLHLGRPMQPPRERSAVEWIPEVGDFHIKWVQSRRYEPPPPFETAGEAYAHRNGAMGAENGFVGIKAAASAALPGDQNATVPIQASHMRIQLWGGSYSFCQGRLMPCTFVRPP